MPFRLPNLAWAPRAAVLAALLPLLAHCGPARNEFAPACPGRAILGDAADLDLYRQGAAADLTDLVLHGRVVAIQGTCRAGDEKDQLAVAASVVVELTRGPAMQGRDVDVPIFLAVTQGDQIIDKRTTLMRATFPSNIDRVTLTPGAMNLVLPIPKGKSGAAYNLVAGFQLTPEDISRVRSSR